MFEKRDIYDVNRNKTKYVKTKDEALLEGEYILISHLCIFNSNNEMLIQKRESTKYDWPDRWDISAGGGAISGETSKQAAVRETFEELGLVVNLDDERPYITIHYPLGFDDYYIIKMDVNLNSLKIQKEEVTSVKWASLDEINMMMQNKEFVNYNKGFIELLFQMSNNRGSYKNE